MIIYMLYSQTKENGDLFTVFSFLFTVWKFPSQILMIFKQFILYVN